MPCAAISGGRKAEGRFSSKRVYLESSPLEMFGADRSNAARPRSARAPWRSVSFMRPSRPLRRRRMCPYRRTNVEVPRVRGTKAGYLHQYGVGVGSREMVHAAGL